MVTAAITEHRFRIQRQHIGRCGRHQVSVLRVAAAAIRTHRILFLLSLHQENNELLLFSTVGCSLHGTMISFSKAKRVRKTNFIPHTRCTPSVFNSSINFV